MIGRIVRLPPVLFLFFLIAGSIAQRFAPFSLGLPSFEAALVGGAILLTLAVTIAWTALANLRTHKTSAEPGQRPTALVTGGIFARTRNPLYLALVLVLCAIAIMADALWLLVAAVFLWLTLDRLVIPAEERLLHEAFADAYGEYKSRVRRWI